MYPDGLMDTYPYLSNPFYARSKKESLTWYLPNFFITQNIEKLFYGTLDEIIKVAHI